MAIKQGEKLLILVKRDKRKVEEIAAAMEYDRSYLARMYKMDVLPKKVIRKAIRVFNLSEDYFGADVEIPDYRPVGEMDEEAVNNEIGRLKEEIARLAAQLAEKDRLNAQLIETLNNLTKPK